MGPLSLHHLLQRRSLPGHGVFLCPWSTAAHIPGRIQGWGPHCRVDEGQSGPVGLDKTETPRSQYPPLKPRYHKMRTFGKVLIYQWNDTSLHWHCWLWRRSCLGHRAFPCPWSTAPHTRGRSQGLRLYYRVCGDRTERAGLGRVRDTTEAVPVAEMQFIHASSIYCVNTIMLSR